MVNEDKKQPLCLSHYTRSKAVTALGQPVSFTAHPDDIAKIKEMLSLVRNIDFPVTGMMTVFGAFILDTYILRGCVLISTIPFYYQHTPPLEKYLYPQGCILKVENCNHCNHCLQTYGSKNESGGAL